MEGTAKVYEAVLEVARDLGRAGIGKRSSQGLRFSYRSIEDVLAALNPLLYQHHLIIYPERIDQEPEQSVSTRGGGVQRLVRTTITYRFVSTEDGSSFTAQALGEGLDSSDTRLRARCSRPSASRLSACQTLTPNREPR